MRWYVTLGDKSSTRASNVADDVRAEWDQCGADPKAVTAIAITVAVAGTATSVIISFHYALIAGHLPT